MKTVIDEKLIDKRIESYLTEHHDDVMAMIDKKIALRVKDTISNAFRNDWNQHGAALEPIADKVNKIIEIEVGKTEIDESEIQQQIQKKVLAEVRKTHFVVTKQR